MNFRLSNSCGLMVRTPCGEERAAPSLLRISKGETRYIGVVPDPGIQVVSNEAGEPTAVIVPIELWREIASERETAYLLKRRR